MQPIIWQDPGAPEWVPFCIFPVHQAQCPSLKYAYPNLDLYFAPILWNAFIDSSLTSSAGMSSGHQEQHHKQKVWEPGSEAFWGIRPLRLLAKTCLVSACFCFNACWLLPKLTSFLIGVLACTPGAFCVSLYFAASPNHINFQHVADLLCDIGFKAISTRI